MLWTDRGPSGYTSGTVTRQSGCYRSERVFRVPELPGPIVRLAPFHGLPDQARQDCAPSDFHLVIGTIRDFNATGLRRASITVSASIIGEEFVDLFQVETGLADRLLSATSLPLLPDDIRGC